MFKRQILVGSATLTNRGRGTVKSLIAELVEAHKPMKRCNLSDAEPVEVGEAVAMQSLFFGRLRNSVEMIKVYPCNIHTAFCGPRFLPEDLKKCRCKGYQIGRGFLQCAPARKEKEGEL